MCHHFFPTQKFRCLADLSNNSRCSNWPCRSLWFLFTSFKKRDKLGQFPATNAEVKRMCLQNYVHIIPSAPSALIHPTPWLFPICALCSVLSCDPVDYSLLASSTYGISQARRQWVAISSSRASSPPRDLTSDSCISCIEGGFFTEKTGKAQSPPVRKLLTFYLLSSKVRQSH